MTPERLAMVAAERQVEIDAMLERTGPGVFIAHGASPVGAHLTRKTDDRWHLVAWDAREDDFFHAHAFKSRTRRRAVETFATLVNFWRADARHPWWDGSQPVERPEPSHTSPMEREHWEEPPTCTYCGERVSVEGAVHNRCEREA